MLSADDHPGIFMFLVGMIVVVMAAVGLSIMADKQQLFSTSAGRLRSEIAEDAAEISELSARNEEQSRLLSDSGSSLNSGSKAHREFSAQLETQRQRQASLETIRPQLRATIVTLEENFARYRAAYRRKAWDTAVGESLGNLTVRGGRVFQKATITRVTDVGLEIRHEHGIARIQAPDLDPKMQDRFQWSDEERRSRLNEELENLSGKSGESDPAVMEGVEPVAEAPPEAPAPPVTRLQKTNDPVDPEKLRLLRLQVSGWNAKVSRLRIDRTDAASRASYGNQSSVPGSLETWVARSSRLGRDLLQAQVALAAAKAELGAVAPYDPMLRQVENEQ